MNTDLYTVYLRGRGGDPNAAVPIKRSNLPPSWWALLHSSIGAYWKDWADTAGGFDYRAELVYLDGRPYQLVPTVDENSFNTLRFWWSTCDQARPEFNFETQGRQHDGSNQL